MKEKVHSTLHGKIALSPDTPWRVPAQRSVASSLLPDPTVAFDSCVQPLRNKSTYL